MRRSAPAATSSRSRRPTSGRYSSPDARPAACRSHSHRSPHPTAVRGPLLRNLGRDIEGGLGALARARLLLVPRRWEWRTVRTVLAAPPWVAGGTSRIPRTSSPGTDCSVPTPKRHRPVAGQPGGARRRGSIPPLTLLLPAGG